MGNDAVSAGAGDKSTADDEEVTLGLFKTAGWRWSPGLVGWGSPGRGSTTEMSGYVSEKLDGKRGRLSTDQRLRQTVDIWSFPGVYALYDRDVLVYVGQAGALGDRLLAHYRRDHLVGRWDSFSWASPLHLKQRTISGEITLSPASSPQFSKPGLEAFLNELEAFAIFFGRPIENRQEPDLAKGTRWLEQVRSEHSEVTVLEVVQAIQNSVAELKVAGGGEE